jgi:hypothetical protein
LEVVTGAWVASNQERGDAYLSHTVYVSWGREERIGGENRD